MPDHDKEAPGLICARSRFVRPGSTAAGRPRRFLWVESDMERLESVSRFLQQTLSRDEEYRESSDERYRIELAVIEACTNVIRHAYAPGTTGRLGVSIRRAGKGLEVLVLDEGPPFDPTRMPSPDLAQPREGGYGIFLMKKLMTEVRYVRRGARWNCLYLLREDRAARAAGRRRRKPGGEPVPGSGRAPRGHTR
ncbi:MAG: ATP-binding protein [bacterium]